MVHFIFWHFVRMSWKSIDLRINIINGCKTDQNISEKVTVSADPAPVLADPFSQHWWVVNELEQDSGTRKYILSGAS